MADFIQFIQQSLRSSSDSSSKSSQTTYEESSTRSEDDASDEESECSISTYFERTVSLRHVRFGDESETIWYDSDYAGPGKLVSGYLDIEDGAGGRIKLFRQLTRQW